MVDVGRVLIVVVALTSSVASITAVLIVFLLTLVVFVVKQVAKRRRRHASPSTLDELNAKSMLEVVQTSEDANLKQASTRRRMLRRLVFGLLVADLINNFSIVLGSIYSIATYDSRTGSLEIGSGPLCDVQGFFQQFSGALQPMYILSMALFMIAAVLVHNTRTLFMIEIGLHVFCVGFGVITAAIPIIMSLAFSDIPALDVSYSGSQVAWCWVAPEPVYARFALLYAWIWASVLLLLVLYGVLSFYLLYNSRATQKSLRVRVSAFNWAIKRLWMFPVAYAALWVLPTINRISEVSEGYILYLALAEALCLPLQGLVDALVYGFFTLLEELRVLRKDPTVDFQLYAYMDQEETQAAEYPLIHAPRLSAWQEYYSDANLSMPIIDATAAKSIAQSADSSSAYEILAQAPYLGRSFENNNNTSLYSSSYNANRDGRLLD